jgi:hypothetical protein
MKGTSIEWWRQTDLRKSNIFQPKRAPRARTHALTHCLFSVLFLFPVKQKMLQSLINVKKCCSKNVAQRNKEVSVRYGANVSVAFRRTTSGAIDLLDREIELVVLPFEVAGELAAAVSQHAQELDADIAELSDELQQSNFCTN